MKLVRLLPLVVLAFALVFPRAARAQVHWDAGLDGGVLKRFVTSRPEGGKDVGLGPMLGIHAHVALMPLLRVGAYADGDVSPAPTGPARRIYSAGLRLKATPPAAFGPSGAMRVWLFTGFGYAGVYAPSYHTQLNILDAGGRASTQDLYARGIGGHFFEIPFGVGMGWRLRKPWELTAELFGRIGVANGGTVYSADGRPASAAGGATPDSVDTSIFNVGQDSWAVGLTLGIGVDL